MSKWIILFENDPGRFDSPVFDVEDIAICNRQGDLLVFDSLDEAHAYQEDHCISGQCVKLPTFRVIKGGSTQ